MKCSNLENMNSILNILLYGICLLFTFESDQSRFFVVDRMQQTRQFSITVYHKKDLTDHQVTTMNGLFIKTRANDPHFLHKAELKGISVESLLTNKFAKSISKDDLYFFTLLSASSTSSSESPSSTETQFCIVGFTIAEKESPTSVYVSRTTIDPTLQNAGMGKAMAKSLGDYFENEVIWGFVNQKQVAVRRFWEVLGAKVTPASVLKVEREFKDYVIYAYRAKL